MNKDFPKVIASVVFGTILICIMFIEPFFLSEIDLTSVSWYTYFLALFIFFVISLVMFNNELVKKYCDGKKIAMKNEVKKFLLSYLFLAILISIVFLFVTFINGGFEYLSKIGVARYEVNKVILQENPRIIVFQKLILVLVFIFLQYYNSQGFCQAVFEKIRNNMFKTRK